MTTTTETTPTETHTCELCGLTVGTDYYSDWRCNTHGVGVVVHTRCAVVLSPLPDARFVALLAAAREAHRVVAYVGLDLDVDAAHERAELATR